MDKVCFQKLTDNYKFIFFSMLIFLFNKNHPLLLSTIQINILTTPACHRTENKFCVIISECPYAWVSCTQTQSSCWIQILLLTPYITETQKGVGLKGPLEITQFNFLLKQVHSEQIAQNWVIWALNICREGDFTTFWGAQKCVVTLKGKKPSRMNFLCFSLPWMPISWI